MLSVLGFALITSCVPKHKFEDSVNLLPDTIMSAVLTDIFIMESYVAEKTAVVNPDTAIKIKKSLYSEILNHHKVDSLEFYTTFFYLQSHPKDFQVVLSMLDSAMNKIKPGDTSVHKPLLTLPKNIENIPNFKEQQKVLQEAYRKTSNVEKLETIKEINKDGRSKK